MKMVKPRLSAIGLRFDAELTFDSLTDEEQFRRGVAHGFIEHHELDTTMAFVQPQMVGWVWAYRLKRIGFYQDCADIIGRL